MGGSMIEKQKEIEDPNWGNEVVFFQSTIINQQ